MSTAKRSSARVPAGAIGTTRAVAARRESDASAAAAVAAASPSPAEDPAATVPPFITKLLAMINDPSTDHLIQWSEGGKTFLVHDATTLAREVLPRFFKHNNFTSLVRQLNMYGFHKVVGVDGGSINSGSDQTWEFVHPCVVRGRPDLLMHVKRKVRSGSNSGPGDKKRFASSEDVSSVVDELNELRGQQSLVTTKFEDMQRENSALWREVVQLRQRHEHQRRMIGKIMEFLSRLVRSEKTLPPGASANRLAIGNDPLMTPTSMANMNDPMPELDRSGPSIEELSSFDQVGSSIPTPPPRSKVKPYDA